MRLFDGKQALVSLVLIAFKACNAAVSCSDDETCVQTLRENSVCVDGFCTNPFYRGGCLANMHPDWQGVRTCSSADGEDAHEKGYCRPAAMNYTEIRIASHNWESAYFNTWIMQIVLSELLNVPVSIETSDPTAVADFYEETTELGFGGTGYDWEGLDLATITGDCRLAKNGTSCSHFFMEGWLDPLPIETETLLDEEKIEPLLDLGAFGVETTFVPKFTAQRDPTVISYLGLQGETNRRKLAGRFLRPATWAEYCKEKSPHGCASSDNVASRMPSEEEADLYFLENHFDGYFRATYENNCDLNPNCTGLYVDWPCGWSSYAQVQVYNLGIPLEPVVYPYNSLLQILSAANATKSDIIFKWWTPSLAYDEYFGSDMEFMRVTKPPPTQACIDARAVIPDRCAETFDDTLVGIEGACEERPLMLRKVLSSAFQSVTQNPQLDKALWSPAYETVKNFQISQLQLSEINQYWLQRKTDKWNYDPKEATCQWIVENLDVIRTFIPDSYPRVVKERTSRQNVGPIIAATLASAMIVATIVSCVLFVRGRSSKSIHHSQVEFLALYCFGLLLIAISALLANFPTSNGVCNLSLWTENVGHACMFILLALKMNAINGYANAGKVMQRVRIPTKHMLIAVGSATGAVAVILLLWSIFDIVRASVLYELTDEINSTDEVAILISNSCSVPRLERIVLFIMDGIILIYGISLGLVISQNKTDLNNGKNLTMLTLVHGVLQSFRFLVLLVSESIEPSTIQIADSALLSVECLVALLVLVIPRLLDPNDDDFSLDEPLPDLFLNSTILLADLVGFTKWSSMREPSSVFKMLETIYGEFDIIAEKLSVFKVETVGDCYVAATGIPDSGTKVANAVSMAKFAARMLQRMAELSKELEMVYGPDTGNMSIRIGFHSGQVTGGFLRGKQSRFQLFGDTINVASRMETTGLAGKIQLSEVTATLLRKGGGEDWVEKRESRVLVKGKGAMQTYWLSNAGIQQCISSRGQRFPIEEVLDAAVENVNRKNRLVEWNTAELYDLLKSIVAQRNKIGAETKVHQLSQKKNYQQIPMAELEEVLCLPAFNETLVNSGRTSKKVAMDPAIRIQLRQYVQAVADRYPANAFHNFSHASHVSLSVIKYLNRISAPSQIETDSERRQATKKTTALLHRQTYGIATDPLVRFACVFSALIHDIEHPGIPNSLVLTENETLASKYNQRSVAEQNSIDIAWDLLFRKEFNVLRTAICRSEAETRCFRQLVINCVLSTDISDRDLKNLRDLRWDRAFGDSKRLSDDNSLNRKATSVLEHLIQAADVAHTMQHWHVYLEWNEKLFQEMYIAYKSGRSPTNPVDFWYDGEDFYIIPLSEKLRDSGIFGVSSDENLNYARANRDEWIEKGQSVVAGYLKNLERLNDAIFADNVNDPILGNSYDTEVVI